MSLGEDLYLGILLPDLANERLMISPRRQFEHLVLSTNLLYTPSWQTDSTVGVKPHHAMPPQLHADKHPSGPHRWDVDGVQL
jgi:hypothetical protein